MEVIKEIILFVYGDSTKASTWSNVPYLMAKTFEKFGIVVDRVNIEPNPLIRGIYNLYNKVIHGKNSYSFIRTPLYMFLTNRRIKYSLRKFPNADFALYLTCDYMSPPNTIPSLVFFDWTYEMYIKDRLSYEVSKRDENVIKNESYVINNADIVLPMFEETYNNLVTKYPKAKLYNFRRNVINNLCDEEPLSPKEKYKSDFVVFIGRKSGYLNGLKILSYACKNVGLRVEAIGISKSDWSDAPDNVVFHGYLHKEVDNERVIYYNLIRKAKLMCNPTGNWAGYSSLIEGMYFNNPIIVTRFKQFEIEFGESIEFGHYVDESIESVTEALHSILKLELNDYVQLCNHAHMRVKGYTWREYVGKMIDIMNNVLSSSH